MYGRILVPFDNLLHLQEALCQALELAESLSAEIILLRVNLPGSKLSTHLDEEYLYSELKALQAQCALWPVAVRIETVGGPVHEAIVGYAAEHGIHLIFSPEIERLVKRRAAAHGETEAVSTPAARGPSPSGGALVNRATGTVGTDVVASAPGIAGAD